jgi:UDP-glucose 4-epimerase
VALAGVDLLLHLAFALWRHRDAVHLNRDGTRNVLAARPGRVVLASSAAVYGAWPDNPLPLTEDQWPRPNPQCRYAVDKLRAERLCQDRAPTVALRIVAVLGGHADIRVARTVRGYRTAVPKMMGKGVALQFLDEDDAARALYLAGLSSAVGILNIAPADWLNAKGMARVAHSRVVALPRPLLLAGAETAYRLHLAPFGSDRGILLNGPLALDPTRAATELGWTATKTSGEVLAAALHRSPI